MHQPPRKSSPPQGVAAAPPLWVKRRRRVASCAAHASVDTTPSLLRAGSSGRHSLRPDEKVTFTTSGSNLSGGGGSVRTNSDGEFSISFKIHNGTEPGDVTTKFSQDGISESVKFKVTG